MGNMDEYIALTTRAKAEGGPDLLLAAIEKAAEIRGIGKGAAGLAVAIAAAAGGKLLWDTYALKQPKDVTDTTASAVATAMAHSWNRVVETRELPGGLTLSVGDRFKPLTRDGDIVMIEIEHRDDNPFPASGAVLTQISDFVLSSLDD